MSLKSKLLIKDASPIKSAGANWPPTVTSILKYLRECGHPVFLGGDQFDSLIFCKVNGENFCVVEYLSTDITNGVERTDINSGDGLSPVAEDAMDWLVSEGWAPCGQSPDGFIRFERKK
jgi:hypothetical protein